MNRKTLTALKESIVHWEGMRDDVEGSGYPTSDHCPLCSLFLTNPSGNEHDCKGCPIVEKTGVQYCRRTPYMSAYIAWGNNRNFERKAQDMIDFLKSLLPKRKRKRFHG